MISVQLLINGGTGVARIFDWGEGGQITNHIGEDHNRKSSSRTEKLICPVN